MSENNNATAMEDMTTEQLLSEVRKAIAVVLVGGQSYKIGSRQLTRADLAALQKLKTQLEEQIASESGHGLLDNTVVAVFDGR